MFKWLECSWQKQIKQPSGGMTNTATFLYSIYKTDYVSRVSKTYRPLRERRNKRQLPPSDSSFKAAKQENRSQGGSDVEINTRALTSHSKHNRSRMKYYGYNLTIPKCRISSNNDGSCRRRFFLFSHIKGLIVRGKRLFEGGDYFTYRLLEVVS